jgi:hypothetical protein
MQPHKLHPLHFQAQLQRIPPADIGAAVGVVPHPCGQNHGAGSQFGPPVGPCSPSNGNQGGVETIDRIAAVGDGGGGLVEFAAEGDRWRPMGIE